ncbi:hypothetical protein PABG_00791 [Paracoccidioides brasiliensis Pb03]|nr:hypothetical protein PABG_00791 [Paracoccidioides brasiliensis Pb03]
MSQFIPEQIPTYEQEWEEKAKPKWVATSPFATFQTVNHHLDLTKPVLHASWKLIKEPGWRKDLEAIMIKAQPTLEDVDLFRRFDLLWDFQKQIEQLPKVTNNRSEKVGSPIHENHMKESQPIPIDMSGARMPSLHDDGSFWTSCATTRIRNGKEYHVVTEQSGFETRTDGHLRVNGGEINEESSAILETKVSIRSAASTMDSRKSANGWQHGYKLNRTK